MTDPPVDDGPCDKPAVVRADPVTVSNWPANQAVAVSNWPATSNVKVVNSDAEKVPVTGSLTSDGGLAADVRIVNGEAEAVPALAVNDGLDPVSVRLKAMFAGLAVAMLVGPVLFRRIGRRGFVR